MTDYDILITDVTCYGDLYCVAGWDVAGERMIRPEPSDTKATSEATRFWDTAAAGPGKAFAVGNLVRLRAQDAPQDFRFPHATEDRLLDGSHALLVLKVFTPPQLVEAVSIGLSPTLEAAFDGGAVRAVSGKVSVAADYPGRSLGAVEIGPNDIDFYVSTNQNGKQQLRAELRIAGNHYDLSVPADEARRMWKSQGIPILQQAAQSSERIHVRPG